MSKNPDPEASPLLRELAQLASIPRWRRAGKAGLLVALAAAAAATRTTQPAVAIAIGVVALIAVGFCFLRAARIEKRLSSAQESILGGYAAKFAAAATAPPPRVEVPAPIILKAMNCEIEIGKPFSLEATEEGRLDLPAGRYPLRLAFAFAAERSSSDEVDYPMLSYEIEAAGATWRARSFLDPDLFTLPVTSSERARRAGLIFWRDVPASWAASLESRALITGISGLLDSRERFELPVGQQQVTMMLKYQGPEIDLGWLPEEQKLVVRISKMYYETLKDGQFDIVDQVTFGYLLDPVELLPLGEIRWNYRNWRDWAEELPAQPPLFEKI